MCSKINPTRHKMASKLMKEIVRIKGCGIQGPDRFTIIIESEIF